MSNRKVRLIQVAKEFKVGLSSITDFLLKKGVSDVSPNSQVNDEVYAMLEKEFGGNKGITGNERDSVRERISLNKQATVTLDQNKTNQPQKEDDEVVIVKSNVINVKDEIQKPKFLGKIDLEPKKPEPKPEVKPEPKPEPKVAEQPKTEPKPEPKVEPKVEETVQEQKKDSVFRPNQTQLAGPQIVRHRGADEQENARHRGL